ncbi:type II toxin-antitoxin system prevent-host-death family antitoxin [Sphingomonas sp.]|jgi:prevent-host-death family protein|uniref:type II toxin-antitoxin system prevent-host-death family antitoxin n=1 Tax=Sphingomonas sp. TaxID=28214 RepID=UPI002E30FAFC|nr:type II toxin-antitoxin system prevent-host-death family antitoxin [Sphingomonas sp.]HEX4694308.1 type II toxin-antitoxin system prevent-host-death family antitoxin [Sphingomonas sp.]
MPESLLAVSAKDVANRFGFYTDEAMQRPIGITRHGTTRVVMLSLKEYERLMRRDRQVIRTEDLDDETLDAILNAEVSERSKALNYLMDDTETG